MRAILAVAVLLILASPYLASAESPRTTYTTLVVEFVGEMDRPVPPVVISTLSDEGEWYKQHLFREQLRFLVHVNVVSAATFNEIMEVSLLNHALENAKSSDEKPKMARNVRFTAGVRHDRSQIMVDAQTSAKILKVMVDLVAKYPTLKSELQEIETHVTQ